MKGWLILAAAALVAGTAGCGGNNDSGEAPAELESFNERVEVRRLWSVRVGRSSERLRLGLSPSTDGARVFAASHGGDVAAFDLETGRRSWASQTNLPLFRRACLWCRHSGPWHY